MEYGKLIVIENTPEAKKEFHKGGWGADDLVITYNDIRALLEGKSLALNDGEYTHTFTLERFVEDE